MCGQQALVVRRAAEGLFALCLYYRVSACCWEDGTGTYGVEGGSVGWFLLAKSYTSKEPKCSLPVVMMCCRQR
jgi:hypothetical protein